MRETLITICPYAIWCIVTAEILLACLLMRLKKSPLVICTMFLTLGLILDAIVIGLGSVLSESILAAISPARFIAHGLLIPLIFPICGYAIGLKKQALTVIWLFTGLLMLAGAAEAIATVLTPKSIAGVVRYAASDETPAWAEAISMVLSFGTVIPMMIIGVFVWIKRKTSNLFLSSFLMFVFSALGPATGNSDLIFFISMFGEVCMVLFLYRFCKKAASQ